MISPRYPEGATFAVEIDGRETTLRLTYAVPGRIYQYTEPGNVRAHSFRRELTRATTIHTNGQTYRVHP